MLLVRKKQAIDLNITDVVWYKPVNSYSSKGEHAGRTDEKVEQGSEVAPHHPKHPLPLCGAHGHKRQHKHGQQHVGRGQAEHKLVAGGKQVRSAVEGRHYHQVPQASEERDGHDGHRLQGSQTFAIPHRGAVPAGVHGERPGHRTGDATVGDYRGGTGGYLQ